MSLAEHPEWGPVRSRTVHWYDPMAAVEEGAGLAGIELLRAARDGLLPPPPMASLVQFEIVDVEPGYVRFRCELDESVDNSLGVVHGGLVCTVADTVTGCAVHSTLAAGITYTSIDLNVSYLRAVTLQSGPLEGVGRVTKPGRRVAFAAAEITGADGKLAATATSSCLVMDNRPEAVGQ